MHIVNVQTRPVFRAKDGRNAGVKLRMAALVDVTESDLVCITPNGMTWHVPKATVARTTLARS